MCDTCTLHIYMYMKRLHSYLLHLFLLQVQHGIDELRKMAFDGVKLKPKPYEPLVVENDSEYDGPFEPNAEDEDFGKDASESMHEFNIRSLMGDHIDLDPSARYLAAKNSFERTIFDATVRLLIV